MMRTNERYRDDAVSIVEESLSRRAEMLDARETKKLAKMRTAVYTYGTGMFCAGATLFLGIAVAYNATRGNVACLGVGIAFTGWFISRAKRLWKEAAA